MKGSGADCHLGEEEPLERLREVYRLERAGEKRPERMVASIMACRPAASRVVASGLSAVECRCGSAACSAVWSVSGASSKS